MAVPQIEFKNKKKKSRSKKADRRVIQEEIATFDLDQLDGITLDELLEFAKDVNKQCSPHDKIVMHYEPHEGWDTEVKIIRERYETDQEYEVRIGIVWPPKV